ncbi:CHAT domain-containing protein [Trichocoleus sp. FACHB-832]|uniref:CHAT domain-containing protein n=1 Tax=Trichocoleus sp. FACHB-832 TaxID=2692875 RepID=UPI001687887C|nr:CHAT domain-containing protein [Trichocoleus sp. FACHB-832]MBD1906444.1 CHAT domain-containing protein [Trichocoleus sp. FACHB-832]
MEEQRLEFLWQVLLATSRSMGNPQVVYLFLQANLDKLDDHFAELLRHWAKTTLPKVELEQAQSIAAAIGNFSSFIGQFPLGIQASNLNIAIACCEIVATVFTREEFPEQWATTQINLGITYKEHILGNPAENLERAIHCFEAALPVFTRGEFPALWARTQRFLGQAYALCMKNRTENLERAIYCFEAALQVLTREAFPQDWAEFQNSLSVAYKERIRGDTAENLEWAIHCCQAALQVRTHEEFPEEWAMTQCNLGAAYIKRILGDKAENLELAIECYEQALQIFTPEAFPQHWVKNQYSLGTAYLTLNRILRDRPENLESAIRCCQAGLQVGTRKTFPQDWADTQIVLGSAYSERILGNKPENLKLAIRYFEAALQIYTRQTFPEKWALLQNNLGIACLFRILEDRAENPELAIRYFEAALEVRTRDDLPEQWAITQNNLGIVYKEKRQIAEAIACFHAALEIRKPTTFPLDCLQTGFNLGDTAFAAQRWAEAIEGYSFAIEAVETSRTWATSESRRQEILEEAISVYQNMVQACINAGQLEKAIETIERSRSKRLVDLMASNDLYQGGEIPPEVKALLQQFDGLQQRIDQERFKYNSDNESGETSKGDCTAFQAKTQAITSLEADKQQIWQQLRRLDPVLAGEIQVIAPDFPAMQKLIDQPTTAILSFYSTSNDTHIFVLRQKQITCHTCTRQGIENLQNWILQKWLKLYVEQGNTWESQISNFLVELAQRLQINDLISQHLQDITELILVPHLALHQIPFAALPLGDGQYLGDKFLISYTPSCQVLEFCQQRGEVEGNLTYGTVEDAEDNLPCASFEGEQIAKIYNIPESDRLRGRSQATISNYRQMASRVQVLHSSHHAESCLDNPLNSQLKLADGNITLGQLMTPGWRLPNLSDVFLSCCETGFGVPEITDDILTLSTGFLCAGARSVISTLWSVDDLATALFSIFYYQYRQQDKSRPESLRQAQFKLREMKKEELLIRNDIQELKKQAVAGFKEANSKRKRYQRGSEARLKWDREFIRYGKLKGQICTLENSPDESPFSHLHYWAAFTCQGLR